MHATFTKITDATQNFRRLEQMVKEGGVKLRTKKGQPWYECYRDATSRKARLMITCQVDGAFDPKDPNQWHAFTGFAFGGTPRSDSAFIDVVWEEKTGWTVHCNIDDRHDKTIPEWMRPLVKKHGLKTKPTRCSAEKAISVMTGCLALYRELAVA